MGKPEVKPIEKMYPEWSKLCDNNVSILATYISNLKFDLVNFLKCVWKGFCYVKFWRYFNHSVNLLQAFMKDLLPVKFFGRCILVGFTQGDNDRD